jgi:hypothetical protein
MPVRGSSTLKSQGQKLHWKPVAKSEDFRPLERASNWTSREHRLFLAKAGLCQHLLGYSVEGSHQPSVIDRLYLRWLQRRWQGLIVRSGLQPLSYGLPTSAAHVAEAQQAVTLRRAA